MKLESIRYNKVDLPAGRDPREALVKAKGAQEIAGALTDSANAIHEINNDYKVKQAELRTQNDLAALEQTYGAREFFTAEEVENFGLADQIETTEGEDHEGKPVKREVIPAHEVYPMLLNRQYEESIRAHSAGIRRPKDRDEFTLAQHERRNEVMTQTIVQAKKAAVAFTLKERQQDIAEAQASGNFAGAALVIEEAYKGNPAMKREMLQENAVKKEEHRARRLAQSGSPEQLREQAALMRTDSYLADAASDSAQVEDQASYLERVADIKEKDLETREAKAYESRVDAHWQAYHDDPVGLVANMPTGLKAEDIRGIQNYAKARAGGEDVKTDDLAYMELSDMLADPTVDPAKFRSKLLKYRHKLSLTDWKHFVDKGQAKADPVKAKDLQTTDERIKTRLGSMGIATSGKKAAPYLANIQRGVDAEQRRQTRIKGRELDDTEVQAIVDSVVRLETHDIDRPGFLAGDAEGKNIFEAIYDGEGSKAPRYLDEIERVLKEMNLPYNAETVEAAYKDILAEGGLD